MGNRVKTTYDRGYVNAIALIRARGIVRAACNYNELFLIRNDI